MPVHIAEIPTHDWKQDAESQAQFLTRRIQGILEHLRVKCQASPLSVSIGVGPYGNSWLVTILLADRRHSARDSSWGTELG